MAIMGQSRSNWKLSIAIVLIAIAIFVLVFIFHGFSEASVRINIRWSARFSLNCFCLAFGASAFDKILKSDFTTRLLYNRKYLGVAFACIHIVHFIFLVLLHYFYDPVFAVSSKIVLALGGLAYLFLCLMLLTSFEPFARKLSQKSWKRLHTIGGYWILIVFSDGIFGRIAGGLYEYIPLGILISCVWIGRLYLLVQEKKAL